MEPNHTTFFFFLPLEFFVLRFDLRKLEEDEGGREGGRGRGRRGEERKYRSLRLLRMCGKFSGEQGSSAEKWLRKFEYDMHGLRDNEGNILPSDYLASIEILLADQAEIWAESTPRVAEILHKAPEATKDNVMTFQLLFKR